MQKVDRYVIYQTVGREAGWLAACAALAKKEEDDAPHLIYVPERPLNRGRFLSDAEKAVKSYGWVSIVCGEGIVWDDGEPVSGADSKDKFSNIEFGAMGGRSAAMNLHQLLKEETGYRGEFQITESLSMCAADRVSDTDREEAFRCGKEAVRLACAGESGKMVSIKRLSSDPYNVEFGCSPLSESAVRAKPMEESYINREGNFVSTGFIDYARPLIGALPEFPRLAYHSVGGGAYE
jgi:6-phosphofructokinase 1